MRKVPSARDLGESEIVGKSLPQAAIQYALRGWRVFPLHTPTAAGCSCLKVDCSSVGKHPRIHNGSRGASSDLAKIRDWWTRWPDANIGIATGLEGGIFVLDVDGDQGQASLGLLQPLPKTLRALTGRKGAGGERKGFHLYFNHATRADLRNSTGLVGKGLDIRAAGGYVIAPPSLHASGLRYRWAADESKIADAPAWLIEKVSKPGDVSVPNHELGFIYDGERDVKLFRLAAKWRRQGATEDNLVARLRGLNLRLCKPPVKDSQVLKIALSAASMAVGSPDPLESAFANANAENHWYTYDTFLAVIRHLESPRPGCCILLPVERIGELMGCDRSLIGRHRKRAIADGFIQKVEEHIPHQKATRFKVIRLPPTLLSH